MIDLGTWTVSAYLAYLEYFRDASTWQSPRWIMGGLNRIVETEGLRGFIDLHIGDVWEVYIGALAVKIILEFLPQQFFNKISPRMRVYIPALISMIFIGALELFPILNNNPDPLDLFGVLAGATSIMGSFELLNFVITNINKAYYLTKNTVSKFNSFLSKITKSTLTVISQLIMSLINHFPIIIKIYPYAIAISFITWAIYHIIIFSTGPPPLP